MANSNDNPSSSDMADMSDAGDGELKINVADSSGTDTRDLKALYKAAEAGNLKKITSLVTEKQININRVFNESFVRKSHRGDTILHILARGVNIEGKLDTVKGVITLGGDVCCPNKVGDLPIHVACKFGHKNLVECFLDANVKCCDVFGSCMFTPLMRTLASFKMDISTDQCTEVLKTLVKFGADVNLVSPKSLISPLHMAAELIDERPTAILCL